MRRRRALRPSLVSLVVAVVAMVSAPAGAAPGDVVWEAITGFGRASGEGSLVLLSPDGATIFEVGTVFPRNPSDVFVKARAAADGSLMWSFRYRDPDLFQDQPVAATLSPDGGRLYVTGVSRLFIDSFFPSYFLTLALDTADGTMLWAEAFRGSDRPERRPQEHEVRDIGVSPNGDSVYVVGRQKTLGGYDDYLTIAYDASTGDERWVRRHDGSSNRTDRPAALVVGADNTVIVTGTSVEVGQAANVVTVAYDGSDGTQSWISSYDGIAHARDAARTMSLSPDGDDLVVSGSSRVGSTETRSNDVLVLDLDPATGMPRWSIVFDEVGPAERGLLSAITQSQVFIGVLIGTIDPFSSAPHAFALVALDLVAGQRVWGQDAGDLADLVVDPTGSALFAVGTSSDVEPSYDAVAYDPATGSVLWSSSWEPLRPNHARAAALAPDSATLYVTGLTESQEGSDMATVAFDAA